MDGLTDRAASGVEPGPARLVLQEIGRHATLSTRPCRQTKAAEFEVWIKIQVLEINIIEATTVAKTELG